FGEEEPEGDEEAGEEELAEDEDLDEAVGAGAEAPSSPAENFFELATSLVIDLSYLADPQARPVIQAAFDADIVDRWLIRPEDVEDNYRKGGWKKPRFNPDTWLREYRSGYREHLDAQRRQAREALRPPPLPRAGPEGEAEFEPPPRLAPIENTGPKLGRNDPCWCGSGKK